MSSHTRKKSSESKGVSVMDVIRLFLLVLDFIIAILRLILG